MAERKPLPGFEGHYETSDAGLHNLRTGETTSPEWIASRMGDEEKVALTAIANGDYSDQPVWALFSVSMGGLANGAFGPGRSPSDLELTELGRQVARHLAKAAVDEEKPAG